MNDLLIYGGTLLIAVAMFALIIFAFVSVLLVALSARLVQWSLVRLTVRLYRRWRSGQVARTAIPSLVPERQVQQVARFADSLLG
ncbi:hypothetical protein IV498_00055 [Paenarthrobacter sp. Z7-10]|uniref:hypothetical protein n=1 Tax=Paenarthrobacter sp. Z7-10 TaxID=2787635 RepID=UPI0022A9C069|nr:hypothetical protein [Paenarthrobacter sp. Z7-10]MCZ2401616.1 hypothetical protein [Paenarthrobacter sp. Z7-10]